METSSHKEQRKKWSSEIQNELYKLTLKKYTKAKEAPTTIPHTTYNILYTYKKIRTGFGA